MALGLCLGSHSGRDDILYATHRQGLVKDRIFCLRGFRTLSKELEKYAGHVTVIRNRSLVKIVVNSLTGLVNYYCRCVATRVRDNPWMAAQT